MPLEHALLSPRRSSLTEKPSILIRVKAFGLDPPLSARLIADNICDMSKN